MFQALFSPSNHNGEEKNRTNEKKKRRSAFRRAPYLCQTKASRLLDESPVGDFSPVILRSEEV